MKIRERLYLSAAITIILVLILLSAVVLTSNKIAEENKKHYLAMEVSNAVFKLNIVTYEYLLHQEERMQEQRYSIYNSIGGILEEESVKSLRTDYVALGDLFRQLTENYEKRQKLIHEGASQEEISATNALKERLIAQLLIKSQSLSTDASRIASESDAKINEVQKSTNNLIFILITILAITVVTASSLVTRSISKPLTKLTKGTEIIGKGNLKHKIDIKSKDEIGELSTAFNKMTESLKVVTASRDELNQEITERKKAEEELEKHTVKLEAANKELAAFSYSVSHDLRAPLRAIDGFGGAIMEDYSDKLDSEGQRLLRVIRKNTRQMGQLIDDLLAFSRTGRQTMGSTKLDMSVIAKTVYKELNSLTSERKLRFEIKRLPPAYGDWSMIHQVWMNLLSNAVKFTRPVDTPVIEVGGTSEENENIYYVKDNGAGFDMKYVDKLFGVFQRLHSASDFEGTGVGLALVQRIIDRHGGRVWAEGQVNEGAAFYFTLPKNEGDLQ